MGREAGSMYFYPRSPRGERPRFLPGRPEAVKNFYPRSPRGERLITASRFRPSSYFYPRSPRGERLYWCSSSRTIFDISIHAPRVGSDYKAEYVG